MSAKVEAPTRWAELSERGQNTAAAAVAALECSERLTERAECCLRTIEHDSSTARHASTRNSWMLLDRSRATRAVRRAESEATKAQSLLDNLAGQERVLTQLHVRLEEETVALSETVGRQRFAATFPLPPAKTGTLPPEEWERCLRDVQYLRRRVRKSVTGPTSAAFSRRLNSALDRVHRAA